MVRRWLAAGIAVALGLLGCVWYAIAAFTISDTVPTAAGSQAVVIMCESGQAWYVGASDALVASDELPDPSLACDQTRTDRRVVSMAFIVAGLAIAGVFISAGRDDED